MTPSRWLRLALLGALLVTLFWLSSLGELAGWIEPTRTEALLARLGAAAPLGFVALMALSVVVSPIPSLPLDLAAGATFGPWLGTLYAALGATSGAVIAFSASRLLGRALIERWLRGHIQFCRECSDKLLFRVVLISRLLPFLSFDLVSYGAGLTRMSLWSFTLATALGTLPLTYLYVTLGARFRIGGVPQVVLGVLMVALFLLLPHWIERHNLLGLRRFFSAHLEAEEVARGAAAGE